MIKSAFILILVFGLLSLLLYLFQERMIFFPQKIVGPKPEAFAADEISFTHEGVGLHGWFIRAKGPGSSVLIVYYGGNAEELSGNLSDFKDFPCASVLLVNYRGYGMSAGRPSQTALFSDAVFILDTIIQREKIHPQRIILMGRSLGSGVAVYVARLRKVAGVILVTPFDSLVEVAKKHYPFFPVRLLLKHRFDSASLAPGIAAPMLGIIAGRDEIIPTSSSQRLMQLWGGPVSTITIPKATHNDVQLHESYRRAIDDFILSLD
jgi:pimeloyl-ACP methyl ester carboxylesterase